MKIINVFDAARDGTYAEFKYYFKKSDINIENKYVDMNLLCLTVINDTNYQDKVKIVEHLISEGININFISPKDKRNALHILCYCNRRSNVNYLLEVTKILIENGIEVNAKDKYGAIPLEYAITTNNLPTSELKELYTFLIQQGSDYLHKDEFNKSCVDYAKEYSWRNEFVNIVEEFENESK